MEDYESVIFSEGGKSTETEMTRDELLAQLRGHGNHLAVVKGTSHDDLARGIGLLLLALDELLGPKRSPAPNGHKMSWPYRARY